MPRHPDPATAERWQQRLRRFARSGLREAFHAWLLEKRRQVLPKSPLGEAVSYALSNWPALMRYTEQGYLAIDNNPAERTLRQVALGRNNWQFCGSAAGGKTAAVLYSVVGTCKHLGLDPFAYLQDVLTRLPTTRVGPLDAFLPDSWQAARQSAPATPPTPATEVTISSAGPAS
jgi:transposase